MNTTETKPKCAPKKRTGARCVVDGLIHAGCEVLFGYPGGYVIDIFDCLYDAPLRFILSRHEQGAAHMADAYARATGKPGCCLVTSGPGATNTVTALATANMDGIPMVCITGQVSLNMIGNDAFQEADVVGITRSVTKHNFLVRNVDELPATLAKAFYIATSGKPGPVVVDIPKNIQQQLTTAVEPDRLDIRAYRPAGPVDDDSVARLAALINASQAPLLYVGGGAVGGDIPGRLAELARKASIPVCETLMGIGIFPCDDPLSLRMAGMHGTLAANKAIYNCDLLLAFGARFDDRVTGKLAAFAPRAKIVHVDIDCSAIGKSVRTDFSINGDLRELLPKLLPLVQPAKHEEWLEQVFTWKSRHPYSYPSIPGTLMPQYVIEQVWEATKGEAIIATDVGQNQMWAAQYYPCKTPRQFLSSGGLGTMGFGLPAAIGAQLGRPDKRVVCITGDGGIQMNFQELVVAVEHKLPILVIILNNTYLGMVRQWQELFYGKRYSGVTLSQHGRQANEGIADSPRYLPDFVKLAEAHGANACRVSTPESVKEILPKALASRQPWVIECLVNPEANVLPMIPPGGSVADTVES
ncbi:MAG: biosynthetic-type acetolactate synthase large subunit [Kiritimatiellae bacterium]|nr:biosynthetic-type acetolactate synthase large subunit [Kiritimatiellia bacterium]